MATCLISLLPVLIALLFWVIAGVEGALLLVSSISDEVTGTTWVESCG